MKYNLWKNVSKIYIKNDKVNRPYLFHHQNIQFFNKYNQNSHHRIASKLLENKLNIYLFFLCMFCIYIHNVSKMFLLFCHKNLHCKGNYYFYPKSSLFCMTNTF